MNSQVWWFVARSSGIIAWGLLTLSVVWGLLLSTKVSTTRIAARRLRPAWLLDLHRHLGGLAVIFTLIHILGIVADSYVTFSWSDILVPMASDWKPGPVAFGVVSFYLLLAIEGTSLAIRHLPRPLWRWVHRTSFVLYAAATYHGITSGTDAGNLWFRVASWISIGVVTLLTIRLLVILRRRPPLAVAPDLDEPEVPLESDPEWAVLAPPVLVGAGAPVPPPTGASPSPSPSSPSAPTSPPPPPPPLPPRLRAWSEARTEARPMAPPSPPLRPSWGVPTAADRVVTDE